MTTILWFLTNGDIREVTLEAMQKLKKRETKNRTYKFAMVWKTECGILKGSHWIFLKKEALKQILELMN